MAPTVLFLALLTIFPTIYLIYSSFSKWELTDYVPRFVGIENFSNLVFHDSMFWLSLRNTFLFTLISVCLELLLGLCIALLFNRPIKTGSLLRSLMILPMVLAPIVVGLLWRVMYNPSFGLINYFLSALGIESRAWIDQSSTALGALIVADVWQWTPFMFLMIYSGLQSLPIEPYEAARVDGATSWQIFRYLTYPMLRQVLIVALLFRIIESVKTFDIIFALTRGGPGTATQTVNIYTFYLAFEWLKPGYAAALTVIITALVTIVGRRLGKLIDSEEEKR